jgi:hypothetical protein
VQAREIQKLQQEAAESRKKGKVPKNYQNHYKYDVKLILRLGRLMFGIIAFLVTLIGCIVLPKYLNNNHNQTIIPTPCIDAVIGDGVCNDRQNIAECRYDGNDCCLSNKNTTFCEDCACHLGKWSN